MNYLTLVGVLVAVIATASAGTFYIAEDTGYKNCAGGWRLNNQTGMHDCASSGASQFCFNLSASSYRCYLGRVIQPPAQNTSIQNVSAGAQVIMPFLNAFMTNANGCPYVCQTDNGVVGSYTLCSCGVKQGYLGELI